MWNKEYENRLVSVLETLKTNFGQVAVQTSAFTLDYSSYYKVEMGNDLLKVFVALDCIVHKSTAVAIKKYSVDLEKEHTLTGRTVNIDPVLVDEYQVVALSKKERGSRLYLSDGVYAEMELFYHHGTFHPFVWTYIDYKENIPFFKQVRKVYLSRIKTV